MLEKKCPKCGKTKPLDEFGRDKHAKDKHQYSCRKCCVIYQQARYQKHRKRIDGYTRFYYQKHPEKMMLNCARYRARMKGYPCNIDVSDIVIPLVCPVLGIPLFRGKGKRTDNSPTLDRIVSERGYIKGNVVVISFRANRIKNDASLEEMRLLVRFYEKHWPKDQSINIGDT